MTRHFLTGTELRAGELSALLDRAAALKAQPLSSDALLRRSVALIFQAPSTRTRTSFETGIAELGGHPMVLRTDELQLSRGESIRDTAYVLSRHAAAIGIRTGPDEVVAELARHASVPVINMLTAGHHPCQALADLLTLREAFGALDGLTLAYVGDGNNVARSLAIVGGMAGVKVRVAAPDGYQLEPLAGVVLTDDPRAAVEGADAVYTDVWVSMSDDPASADARRRALAPYRIDDRLMNLAAPHAIALHCLPAHPGDEITSRFCTASVSGSGTRPRTVAMHRRHCWSYSSPESKRADRADWRQFGYPRGKRPVNKEQEPQMPPAKRSPSASSSSSSSSRSSSKRTTASARGNGARSTQAAARGGAKSTATSARKAAGRTTAQAKSGATKTRNTARSGASQTARAAKSTGAAAATTAKTAGAAAATTARSARAGAKGTATATRAGAKNTRTSAKAASTRTRRASGGSQSIVSIAEQLAKGEIKPRDVVMLTRDHIQETLDDAAERGRVTRKDANELVAELVRRGRSQGDEVLGELEGLVTKGRGELKSATKRARSSQSVDRIVRSADRARRTVGVGPSFPILGYDELNATQVQSRLKELKKPELRKVLTYERKHANRKSVVGAIEKSLS